MDIDIFLEKDKQEIIIEAKSFYIVLNHFDEEQIKERIVSWKAHKGEESPETLNFILSIWKFIETDMEVLRDKLQIFKEVIEKEFSFVAFGVEYVILKSEFSDFQIDNSYNQALKKIEDISNFITIKT